MNREEAKLELDATTLRPQDASAEARELLQSDAELREWHAKRTAFDEKVADTLAASIPAGLKESILQRAKQPQRRSGVRWIAPVILTAAVACIAGAWLLLWPVHGGMPAWQADAMAEVTKLEYGMGRLDDRAPTLDELKAMLVATNSPAPEALPAALAATRTFGCKRITVDGKAATIICFRIGEGRQEAHLVVVDAANASPPSPKLEQSKNWSLASWSAGTKTYMLATTQGAAELRRLLGLV
ncbi:MAG: hypothetical protein JNG86_10770 [Verrucomicrobiaceae bacterium]|nr:hypothetical protein [Verrucomicrobiaceae bacterium]